jgi:hypothetical protein
VRASPICVDVRMARWSVTLIRKRADHLGTVVAPNEKEAIKLAMVRFEIASWRQNRILVTKISGGDDD